MSARSDQTLRAARPAAMVAGALVAAWLTGGNAMAQAPALPGPAVPDALRPAGAEFAQTVFASGVQIYECRAGASGPAWTFVAPEATLYDRDGGTVVGSHGAGPFWQASDGSRIVAAVSARQNAPNAADIPWLLLEVKETSSTGTFSQTRFVQRHETSGGMAPADGCDASGVGRMLRVPYTSKYSFWNKLHAG